MEDILKQIERKQEEKQILMKRIEAKRLEIVSMNIEISSFEKLREKELDKYNKALIKSEELFIEEFVSNKSMTNEYAL